MKQTLHCAAIALLFSTLNSQLSTAHAQGTAFTYQGRLNTGGSAASGLYDFRFRLALDNQGQNYGGEPCLTNGIGVTNGLFATTIDFGAGWFNGSNYWLEVDVRTNGASSYTALAPLQALMPAPYAVFAGSASNVSGTVSAGQLSGTVPLAQLPASVVTNHATGVVFNGTFTGNGANVTNVNATALNGLKATNFWQLGGNSVAVGQFLGSTNNQPVELHVNGARALRLEPDSSGQGAPNVIGGAVVNFVASGMVGATIGGGGCTNFQGFGSFTNSVNGNFATVGGGANNQANYDYSTVGGGQQNTANNYNSTVGGGAGNTASGGLNGGATVGGGINNQATADYSTVGGGENNTASGFGSFIGSGYGNSTQPDTDHSFIGGGDRNSIQANALYSVLGGGYFNTNSAKLSVLGGGKNNSIQPNADHSFLGGGYGNSIQPNALYSFLGGGYGNSIQPNVSDSVLGGGDSNSIQTNANHSVLGGGGYNTIQPNAQYSVIGGGYFNTAGGECSTVPGGTNNTAGGFASFAAGQNAQALSDGTFVWADTQSGTYADNGDNSFNIRAQGGVFLDNSTPAINFGGTTKQMLNLYGLGFGIGVQSDTEYFRSVSGYAWFKGGSHNDNQNNPGGGTLLMTLDGSGNLECMGTVYSKGIALTSDRNAKEHFTALDGQAVLAKVAALPVTEWNYRTDSQTVQHIGPMAQDFHAAFGLDGADDKHISVVDEGGVALAAIQGLNEKLEARSEKLEAENAALKAQMAELKALVKQLAQPK